MPDIASLGLKVDTSQVLDGKKALDQFADSSSKADQGARSLNGQMNDTAKIMRAQAEQARATAAANTALGNSSGAASIGAQLFIEKLQEQAAVLGMSRSQLAAYQAAQLGVAKEAEASIAKIKAYEDAIKAAADAKAAAAKQTNVLTEAIGLLAKGYAALKVAEYIKDAALLAARYETLGVVTEVVGRNAGYTKTQMDSATAAIAAQGITMIESRESATKLVQAHVDLRYATQLARIAQDAAVIGHINSSEAFDRLVNGIARGNVLILRNIGINVNMESAYRQMGQTLGKNANDLTENERVQARLNAVLERGTDIAGTYSAAMDTAGKQLTSMQRYTQDLKTVIGETFNETLTIAVMALTDGLKDANKEVSELSKNQQLHEWGRSLADVFIGVANKVGNATTVLQKAWAWADHKSARDDINAKYDGQVESALSEGSLLDVSGRNAKQRRINAERAAALAEEDVAYATRQAKLSAQFDAFERAAAEREATITAKHKAEAEARLKVDQDYAKAASDILLQAASKGAAAQEDARKKVIALYDTTYVGTPTYKDTDPRPPKAKVDKVESTELADRLARMQDAVNAQRAMYENLGKLDDAYHAAGKLGDEEYYQNKRARLVVSGQDQFDAYSDQIAALKAYHNGTAAEAAKHAKQINDIEAKQQAAYNDNQAAIDLADKKEILRKDAIVSASDAASNKYLASLDQEAQKLEDGNAAQETSKAAVERKTISLYDQAIAYQQSFIAQQEANGANAEEIAQAPVILKTLEDQRAARVRIAVALERKQSFESDVAKAKDLLEILKGVDDAARQAAQGMEDSFGRVGAAIGGLTIALTGYAVQQQAIAAQLAAVKADPKSSAQKIAQAELAASKASAQAQIKSYGDMSSAAKGFFSENSKGYKALEATEKAFRAYEMAMALTSMTKKIFFKQGEVAANTTLNATKLSGEAATSAASTGLAATEASAWGITAVVKALASLPFPANLAAGAATLAAVIAIGAKLTGNLSGGGGGGATAEEVQKVQGTGTVFGDSTAKTDSIRRSIEQLEANSDSMLPINQGMLVALKSIESAMTGLTNLVVRTTGLTDGTNLGIAEGTVSNVDGALGDFMTHLNRALAGIFHGDQLTKALFGKTTQTIIDSGLQYGGSIRDLQSGDAFEQYASIDTTKKSLFGLVKSTSNRIETAALSDELSQQFGLIFTNLDKSLQAAAVAMGGSAADVTAVLDSLTLETTKISLKGLTGDDLTDALNSVISKSMDQMAEAVFPEMDKFRQVGEGYAETVIRIATDYAKLDSILASSSATFGATGLASIAARERLIELAGGIDELASQQSSFNENFLSKAEQLAPVQKYVTDQLAAMGLQSLDTRDKFKDYVLGLANSGALVTEAGAQQYAALLALSEAFAKTHAATVDLTKSEQEIADERTDLQNKLDELTMTQAQLAEKARNAIDSHNLALYDQVVAAQAAKDATANLLTGLSTAYSNLSTVIAAQKEVLNEAYTAASEALQAGIDTATASVSKLSSLSQSLQSTLDSMSIPGQEKQERAAAQAKIEAALAIAKAGGPLPDADALKSALSTVSKEASGQFATALDYQRDLYRTKNAIAALGGLTDTQLTTEQQALDTLKAQKTALDAAHKAEIAVLDKQLDEAKKMTDLLSGISTSLLTLPDALKAIALAVAGAQKDTGVGTDALTSLYQTLLGRAPDAAGLAYWQQVLAGGASMTDIANGIMNDYEYKGLHPFAVGTNYVPGDMPAMIHEGERIIPAADNRELMARLSGSGNDNSALVAEIRALRTELSEVKAQVKRGADSSETSTGLFKRVIRNDRLYASTKEEATA